MVFDYYIENPDEEIRRRQREAELGGNLASHIKSRLRAGLPVSTYQRLQLDILEDVIPKLHTLVSYISEICQISGIEEQSTHWRFFFELQNNITDYLTIYFVEELWRRLLARWLQITDRRLALTLDDTGLSTTYAWLGCFPPYEFANVRISCAATGIYLPPSAITLESVISEALEDDVDLQQQSIQSIYTHGDVYLYIKDKDFSTVQGILPRA